MTWMDRLAWLIAGLVIVSVITVLFFLTTVEP